MKGTEEKLGGGEIVIPKGRVAKALENYWYHYKWHTIIVAFFVFVFGVCFAQCAGNKHADVLVTYAGGYTLSGEERNTMDNILTQLATNPGEERCDVVFNTYSIYTEEELRAQYFGDETDSAQNSAALSAYNSAKQNNINYLSNFSNFLLTGESAVFFVSEWVYSTRMKPDRLMSLESVLGETPDSAYDAYAIRLRDTALYQYYEALQFLPEDTLVVLMQPTFVGEISKDDVYAQHKALFCNIVNFQAN